jgi:hypothetical protein
MEPQIKWQTGLGSSLSSAIGFTPHKFTQPPAVACQIIRTMRDVAQAGPVYVYTSNITKDSFQYTVKGDRRVGDQVSWIAIGS